MIAVEIEGGVGASFPDGTPQEVIDAAVQRLIGAPDPQPAPEAGGGGETAVLLAEMFSGAVQKMQLEKQQDAQLAAEAQQGSLAAQSQVAEGQAQAQGQATAQASEQVTEGLLQVAEVFAQGLNAMAEKDASQEVAAGLDKLSLTLVEVGSAIINVMKLPTTIQHDKSGTPKGMRRGK